MGALQDLMKYAADKVAKATGTAPKSMGLPGNGAFIRYGDDITGVDSSKLETALNGADLGDTAALVSMTGGMLEMDASIAAHWHTRRNALLGLDWDIVDSQADGKANKDTGIVRNAIDNGCLRTALECLADAPMYGFAGAFIDWDATTNAPMKALPVHPTRWLFDLGGNPAIMIPDEANNPTPTPIGTFETGKLVHAVASTSTHPGRSGLCRPLLWIHLFMSQGMKTRARYIEKFGIPFLHGILTEAQYNDETLRKKYHSDLSAAARLNALVSMEGCELKIEGHTGAAANADHGKWLADLDAMAAKLILGQTGTSGDSSGMSNGGAQTEVREAILAADARLVSEALATCLVRPAATFLGLKDPQRFEFVFDIRPPAEMAQKAMMVKTLADAGYKADRMWISETFSVPLQEEVAPISPIGRISPIEDQPKELPLSDNPAKPFQLERVVADAAAAVASKAFTSVEDMAAFYGPIRQVVGMAFNDIDTSKDGWFEHGMARLTELSASLPSAVRAMDFNAFADALRQAQNGAAAEGYKAF